MKRIISTLCAAVVAFSTVAALSVPASAQHRHGFHGHYGHHGGFYHHGNWGYYNGHRGYRHYHHGYRYHNGWWFPATAFLGAAIIGNAIANSAPAYRGGHVQWCYDHYRSYRASDNTYQPYNGPRRQCVSPY